jgi:hypothetical protein
VRAAEARQVLGFAAVVGLLLAAVGLAQLVRNVDVALLLVRVAEAPHAINRAAEGWLLLAAVGLAPLALDVDVVVLLVSLIRRCSNITIHGPKEQRAEQSAATTGTL